MYSKSVFVGAQLHALASRIFSLCKSSYNLNLRQQHSVLVILRSVAIV